MNFKKIFGGLVIAAITMLLPWGAAAQVSSNYWKLIGGTLMPVVSTWPLEIPQLGGSGTLCLHTDNNGKISTSSADCGTGSGGGVASTSPFVSGQIVIVSGTAISTNGYLVTDFLPSSTVYIATNTGNWAGTWQGVNSSTFYLASNPSSYISTSTGLTTANFATTSISQWNNNSGYITTSTYNASMTIATVAPLSGGASLANNTTISLSLATTTFLMKADNLSGLTNTSTAQTNLGLGSIATHPTTDYLPSSTAYVSTFNGASGAVTGVNSIAGATGTVTIATSGPLLSVSRSGAQLTFTTIATSTILSGYSTSTGANPTATVGATATNGSANTFMRSDAAPALASQYASSTWNFVIYNATTTASTTNYTSWQSSTPGTLAKIWCYDSVGTTTLNFFEPTAWTTSTVSSTIAGSLACGTAGNSSTLSTTFPVNQAFIVEVSSTAGTPVATPVHIYWKK